MLKQATIIINFFKKINYKVYYPIFLNININLLKKDNDLHIIF